MKKARLIVTYDCDRTCAGCCNRNWTGAPPKVIGSYRDYDEIYITGGEPLLFPDQLLDLIFYIRKRSDARVFVYTAAADRHEDLAYVQSVAHGITLTLHTQGDADHFGRFLATQKNAAPPLKGKTFRLNVFKGVISPYPWYWTVKAGIEWIKDCPLPNGEVLCRLAKPWARRV